MHPLLQRPIPIWQAPTGSIAGSRLCIAVSSAGGMGSMGLTWTSIEDAVLAVHNVRNETAQPFMVNFALAFPPQSLSAVLDAGAPIVSFSWGQPAGLVKTVQNSGALAGVAVGSAKGADIALQDGVDFLVVQGCEAGGHVQSSTQLQTLLPQILEISGDIPVVASGGIASGAQIAKFLGLGADAVMMGTRFVATTESRAHNDYRKLLVEATADKTVLTGCFDVGWPMAPHRVLRNSTFEAWEASGYASGESRPGKNEIIATTQGGCPIFRYEDTAPMEGMNGDVEAMCCYAGTGVSFVTEILSAVDVVRDLWSSAVEQSKGLNIV